ncbi:hypothetical protein pb186bvf_012303 [Paramecium bursaria]
MQCFNHLQIIDGQILKTSYNSNTFIILLIIIMANSYIFNQNNIIHSTQKF